MQREFYIHGSIVVVAFLTSFIILVISIRSADLNVEKQEDMRLEMETNTNKFLLQNSYTLKRICSDTKWRPGLYLNCTNIYPLYGSPPNTANPQGATNTYNIIMTCLRWAIDAGTGFVIPRLAIRSTKDVRYFDEWGDYDFLFDEDFLRDSLARECPQLTIVNSTMNFTHKIETERIPYNRFSYGEYKVHVDKLLKQNGLDSSPSSSVITIWENEQLFNWKFSNDSPIVISTLRNAIIPNNKIRSISKALRGIMPFEYFGIHLRLEADMIIGSYTDQILYFLKHYVEVPNHDTIKTIYVSTGDRSIEEKFRTEMRPLDLNVISKWSLTLNNAALEEELKSLRFDQLALLEWDILVGSYHFFGCTSSAFSFSVANQRGSGNVAECRCHLFGDIYLPFLCCI